MDQAPAPVEVKKHAPKFVRWAVMLGIVIALNIFLFVVRSTVFPEPQFTDFCPVRQTAQPADEKSCLAESGIWNVQPGIVPGEAPTKIAAPGGYCDLTTKCQAAYEQALKPYKLHAFELALALGVLALIAGVLPLGSSIVSTGLSYGGVLAFVIGAIQYWSEAGSIIRLLISAAALIILIIIGLKRFRD